MGKPQLTFKQYMWLLSATEKLRIWMRHTDIGEMNLEHPHQHVQQLHACVVSLTLMEHCKMWTTDTLTDLAVDLTMEVLRQCYRPSHNLWGSL